MKKILPALVLGSLLVSLAVPALVSAQQEELGPRECCRITRDFTLAGRSFSAGNIVGKPGGLCPGGLTAPIDDWGIVCMFNTIHTATDWFFYILIVLSTIMVIWGAFGILFAAGDPEKITKGRTVVVYALVGIAIALFARVIPSIVKFMMGM